MNEIIQVTSEENITLVRQLFREYASSLSIDLCFQNFNEELNALPGAYAPPRGALFLATFEGKMAGCIGLRPFSDSVGELKRLYVKPEYRRYGIGRSLVSAAITAAEKIGYTALVLDTLSSMRSAIALYESFGFERTDAYYGNPLPEVVYFRKTLASGGSR